MMRLNAVGLSNGTNRRIQAAWFSWIAGYSGLIRARVDVASSGR
jgi:hypothetical protein